MKLYNKRMLIIMDHIVNKGAEHFKKDFCIRIGLNPGNLHKIKKEKIGFTIQHIYECVKLYKINPDYFFKKEAKMYK